MVEPHKNPHPNLIDPETALRPRIKELEVMVAEVVRETPDSATIVLFTGNDRLEYLANGMKLRHTLWRASACPTSGSTGRATGRPPGSPVRNSRGPDENSGGPDRDWRCPDENPRGRFRNYFPRRTAPPPGASPPRAHADPTPPG
ncbi:MAG: 3-ketosteroid 9alpha-monooxygenase subunit [Acidobacteriota bacterium]|jgi:hypothetical protein|nr:3-ketosteroid 9alpha-monooxygenase subunit [Acidobacteriota bacterium]